MSASTTTGLDRMEPGPMTSTPHHSPIAAAGHFVEAERLLSAVPLAKKGDQDR